MKYIKAVALLVVLIAVSGCGKFDVINRSTPDLLQAEKVCIVNHPDTREGFEAALKQWLTKENINNQVIPASSRSDACEWVLRYYGYWSWDMALFLSDAEIRAYHDGNEAGEVKLRVGQWDSHKFESGEKRIGKMMDMLSGKADHYVIAKPKNRVEAR
ncbi:MULTISPECIES: Sbal_3080 family lipoprotein [unclassified Maridesulfovibrio]|uniref:Sbal_3080 family lipoprotein n=1 Tax=unclassified Maridesulfovibrio TaxID=2794999 RepID=UPI003B41484E